MSFGSGCGVALAGLIALVACEPGSPRDLDAGIDAGIDDAGGCFGDAAVWSAALAEPLACTKNSDCCVVINLCLYAAEVMTAATASTSGWAWPYCMNQCSACIPFGVQVGCANGSCVAVGLDYDAGVFLMNSHCGVDDGTVFTGGLTQLECE